jgi:hypothetical protein
MKKMMGFVLACVLVIAFSAQAAVRDTPERIGDLVAVGVASNTLIYRGTMVAVSATGYALPAADTAGLKVLGRAESTVDNSGTAGDGAQTIVVRRGIFQWANGDTYTIADIGTLAYVEDSATVQKAASATHDIIAGLILDVDADGVWVDTYSLPASGSATVVNLTATGNAAVTGNATVGGTLGVTGASTLASAGVTGNATVGGTLAVTGVATFTAAPKLTAVTSAGAETVTMTNAPAAGDPVWVDISVGTNTYVVPLFPAE